MKCKYDIKLQSVIVLTPLSIPDPQVCVCQTQVLNCCLLFLSGSVPSLAAGLLFGGLAGFGAYQISNNPDNVWVSLGGWMTMLFFVFLFFFFERCCRWTVALCLTVTSGALTGIMGKRFYASKKFMPAGLIAGTRY